MRKRRLGRTGLYVSEIAFGGWQLGDRHQWGGMRDAQALELVAAACDRGCNLFDTAPNYAQGNSERLLGEALKGRREEMIIVSKFGHRVEDSTPDFSVTHFRESLHASLRRLQTDYLDVLLLHSPPGAILHGSDDLWEAIRQARSEGKIRFMGASVDSAEEASQLLANADTQVVELLFNMLHQDVRRSFHLLRERDVGVIAKVPLDSGWLSGKYDAESHFGGIRERWSQADIAQRAKAVADLKALLPADCDLAQQALAFLLSYDEVSAVIPGAKSLRQVDANMSAAGTRLPPNTRLRIEALWETLTDSGNTPLPW